jgi:dTDP-4-amino-4,6-dideoxygalactose transaminase
LGVNHISLFTNGTIALVTAIQALGIKGEVITTPYSFVATAHSLLWNGITPVFVDIDKKTLNLDPQRIEEAITPETKAIIPVHCYGNPCDVKEINRIAEKHNLKVLYDAAHAFGVNDASGSILNHGDLSVLSFHATKVFNTFEGGAIISPDEKTKQYIDQLKNFGITDEVTVVAPGINGKMSEINAAFGLLQLKHLQTGIERRKDINKKYRLELANINGIKCVDEIDHVNGNYSYFPVLIQPEFKLTRDELYNKLKDYNIFTRRYFYPLISDFPMYSELASAKHSNLPNARDIASKVLCLPIYPALSIDDQDYIISCIKKLG